MSQHDTHTNKSMKPPTHNKRSGVWVWHMGQRQQLPHEAPTWDPKRSEPQLTTRAASTEILQRYIVELYKTLRRWPWRVGSAADLDDIFDPHYTRALVGRCKLTLSNPS